jgi:3-hydroxyacyl-CoA dehydrogenase
VSPSDIEQAARGLGMRQGPLQLMDILGAGRSLTLMRRILEHRGAPLTPLRLLSDRIADVTDGEDTKAGRALVFHTQAGQSFARDPDFPGWVHDWRTDYPDRAINWPDVSLDQAMLAAMVNEAARLRRTKAVHRLSDIDLAAEKGLFMDRKHGGPLIQADLKGLLGIARTMRRLTQVDEDLWTVDPLITDMIKTGDTFF